MTRLSVNINKVALLRNSRGGHIPDVVQVAKDCESFGAEGITVHPRPDGRHILYSDVYDLKDVVTTEFNIEGFPSDGFLNMVCEVRPHQCTLVPDPPDVLTSDTGWDTVENLGFLKDVVARLHEHNIRVSLFLNAEEAMVNGAAESGADRIELYTGEYATTYSQDPATAVLPHTTTAKAAIASGLGVNAGHDLSLENLSYYSQNVPGLLEVSIGHALIADALYYGLQNVVGMYLHQLRKR